MLRRSHRAIMAREILHRHRSADQEGLRRRRSTLAALACPFDKRSLDISSKRRTASVSETSRRGPAPRARGGFARRPSVTAPSPRRCTRRLLPGDAGARAVDVALRLFCDKQSRLRPGTMTKARRRGPVHGSRSRDRTIAARGCEQDRQVNGSNGALAYALQNVSTASAPTRTRTASQSRKPPDPPRKRIDRCNAGCSSRSALSPRADSLQRRNFLRELLLDAGSRGFADFDVRGDHSDEPAPGEHEYLVFVARK